MNAGNGEGDRNAAFLDIDQSGRQVQDEMLGTALRAFALRFNTYVSGAVQIAEILDG